MPAAPRYAVITPARDEAENLPRVAQAIAGQALRPERWIVVDNGSTDGTAAIVAELARTHDWIRLLQTPGAPSARRGGASVRAFQAGVTALDLPVDFVVNHDADITVSPGYFACLLDAFAEDPELGIAGGTCYERERGVWQQRFVTGTTVWGGSRMYRHACLADVQPIDEVVGWDGIAEAKARMRGWTTRIFHDLPFLHHRPEGTRDGTPWAARVAEGRSAHYMGYRPWYLILRALRHSVPRPSGLGLLWGYTSAILRREQSCPDPSVRAYVRRQQRLSRVPQRLLESFGRS